MSSSSGSLQLPDNIQSESELSLAADAEVAGTDDVSMPSFVSEASAAGPLLAPALETQSRGWLDSQSQSDNDEANGFDESVDLPSGLDTDSDAELPSHMDGVEQGSDLRVPTPAEASSMPRACLKFAEYYSPPRVARLLTHLLTLFL